MTEYIERDTLIREILSDMAMFCGSPDEVQKHDEQCNYAISCIENASAADVVPVVCCKDCKYSRPLNKSEKERFVEGGSNVY